MIKNSLKFFGLFFLSWLLYISLVLIYGTATDFQPAAKLPLKTTQENKSQNLTDSIVNLISWNLGYAGLGAASNFFYDNENAFFLSHGKMVISPKENVDKNIAGIIDYLKTSDADFYLFQEIDLNSKRSYYTDQLALLAKMKPSFQATVGINYNVGYVPVPVLEPWNTYGQALSGLGSLSRFQPSEATRFQLPGSFDWPDNVFQLDRCAAVLRFPTPAGKELIVVNIHNSAYDTNGTLKSQQMDFLREMFLAEYKKGNYIIAGGDWNQCPPSFRYDSFKDQNTPPSKETNIAADFFPAEWKWVYDSNVPTNRRMRDTYVKGQTFTTIIDFFLVSPNVETLEIKGIDLDFQFSDHQPVFLKAKLSGFEGGKHQMVIN